MRLHATTWYQAVFRRFSRQTKLTSHLESPRNSLIFPSCILVLMRLNAGVDYERESKHDPFGVLN